MSQTTPAEETADPKPYTTRSGVRQWKPSFTWIEQAGEDNEGFCLACAAVQGDVEPDARRYRCENCGAHKVYGAAELALMGLCHLDGP